MTERGAAFLLPLPLRERAGVRGGQEGGRDRAYWMTGKRKNAGFPLETCGNDRRGDGGNVRMTLWKGPDHIGQGPDDVGQGQRMPLAQGLKRKSPTGQEAQPGGCVGGMAGMAHPGGGEAQFATVGERVAPLSRDVHLPARRRQVGRQG